MPKISTHCNQCNAEKGVSFQVSWDKGFQQIKGPVIEDCEHAFSCLPKRWQEMLLAIKTPPAQTCPTCHSSGLARG